MNAILGQFSVDLSFARPAKIVDVEFDSVYHIATASGTYTPCPSCAKDSWFQNFTAWPITQYGTGLQGIGFSSARDEWGNNVTYGNYEDTIFGRAGFLPPTMIAFSHFNKTGTQTQRQDRLKTQAALFANGYQRAWYGFNKGALIGSFDGVTWFAVGKGRIARATSDKLYLAINAPFADLAANTSHVVQIRAYDGISSGAHYDFNPNLDLDHPEQNEAGICQNFHTCNTDADCISNLGWEYVCADTAQYSTYWPSFEAIDAQERANTKASGLVSLFLKSAGLPRGF